jgi:hypothetical protein
VQKGDSYDMVVPQAYYYWKDDGLRMLAMRYSSVGGGNLLNVSANRLVSSDQQCFLEDSKVIACNDDFLEITKGWSQVLDADADGSNEDENAETGGGRARPRSSKRRSLPPKGCVCLFTKYCLVKQSVTLETEWLLMRDMHRVDANLQNTKYQVLSRHKRYHY